MMPVADQTATYSSNMIIMTGRLDKIFLKRLNIQCIRVDLFH